MYLLFVRGKENLYFVRNGVETDYSMWAVTISLIIPDILGSILEKCQPRLRIIRKWLVNLNFVKSFIKLSLLCRGWNNDKNDEFW